jgi:hypothetical protein
MALSRQFRTLAEATRISSFRPFLAQCAQCPLRNAARHHARTPITSKLAFFSKANLFC